MDKTLKLRAFKDAAKSDLAKGYAAAQKDKSEELTKKDALLEEERSKSHDLLKTIVQLRESLKQEQERSAELKAKITKLDAVEENQLAKKNAQLEAEKKQSLEYMRMIEQLRETIKQEQVQSEELKARLKKLDALDEGMFINKSVQREEEKKELQEHVKKIEQLKENLKEEQVRSAELKARLTKLDSVEENQLVKKNTQLEEEKKKSLEQSKTIEQLKASVKELQDSLKQEQEKKTDLVKQSEELKAKQTELAMMEDKLKDLSGMLKQITSIAASGNFKNNP